MIKGAILTSASTLEYVRQQTRGLGALKVVPFWGLPWTPALRREAQRLLPLTLIRTASGDPSSGRPFLLNAAAEIRPWWEERDPARPFWVELGNEPLIEPTEDEQYAWVYTHYLDVAISELRREFPGVKLIAPAHMLNDPVRLGAHPSGQRRFTDIAKEVYRRCDAVALHAYTVEQFEAGRRMVRDLVGTHPLWVTEFALNAQHEPAYRGALYARTVEKWDVEAVFLYHIATEGGDHAIHFDADYSLERATIEHFAQEPAPAPPNPVPPPPMTDTAISIKPSTHIYSRDGAEVLAGIAHATGGTNSLGWLIKNPEGVSAHALFPKSGRIIRMVPDDKAAGHVGFSQIRLRQRLYGKSTTPNTNQITLGAEIENRNNGADPYPDAQLIAVGWQFADWLLRFPNLTLLKHADIDTQGKVDPHSLSWARIHAAMAPFLVPAKAGRYRVRLATAVYERPDPYAPVAWKGEAELPAGAIETLSPAPFTTWLHWAPGGFVPRFAVEGL